MGILCYVSSAPDLATPVKNACRSSCSYGWSAFVSIGAAARIRTRRFALHSKATAEPPIGRSQYPFIPEALNSGGVPGNDDPIKNIINEVKEMNTETSKISVNANDMDNEDSVTQKISDLGTVEKNVEGDDVHDETQRSGIWGYVSPAVGSVKHKVPDLTPASDLQLWPLSAAKDDSLWVDAMGKLKNYLQDERFRVFVKTVNDVSSKFIRKKVCCVPGGLKAYNMILKSLYKLGDSLQSDYQSHSNCKDTEDLKTNIIAIILNAAIFLLLLASPSLLSATRGMDLGIYYNVKQKLLDLNKKIYNSVKSFVNNVDAAVRGATEKDWSDLTSLPKSPILTIILELAESFSGGGTNSKSLQKNPMDWATIVLEICSVLSQYAL